MVNPPTARKLNVIVRPKTGGEYETWAEARRRADGRYDGVLDFRPVGSGHGVTTPVQTTQADADSVFYWAAGLSIAHIENAFASAAVPFARDPAVPSPESTPPGASERLAHLQPVERDVLSLFQSRRTSRINTREFFERGPYANADFVRAFEDLEKRWRLVVRHTEAGVDCLELTVEGARMLGLEVR